MDARDGSHSLGTLVDIGTGTGRMIELLGPAATQALGGLTYLQFLAPGLLAATAMQAAAFEATFPIMAGLEWSRVFHAMHATPISGRDIALGNLAWIAAQTTQIRLGTFVYLYLFISVPGTFDLQLGFVNDHRLVVPLLIIGGAALIVLLIKVFWSRIKGLFAWPGTR